MEIKLRGEYYFTSEKGLFRLDRNGVFRVLDIPCYGISFRDQRVFLSLHLPGNGLSVVVEGDRGALCGAGRPFNFRVLYDLSSVSSNNRIHGIFAGDEALWVANTGRNTLLKIDLGSGLVAAEIPPFLDRFGLPVLSDQNHINSVAEYNGTVLFVAYRAGGMSMIGVYDGHRVTGYGYPNAGAHDIFVTANSFFMCDTFGPSAPAHNDHHPRGGVGPILAQDHGGVIVTSTGRLDGPFFEQPPGFTLRGLAGSEDEMLIGHSHKGSRKKRFKGHGAILISRHWKIIGKIDVAPSQVYQIITEDGDFLLPKPNSLESDDMRSRLAGAFGEPIYNTEIEPLTPSGSPP